MLMSVNYAMDKICNLQKCQMKFSRHVLNASLTIARLQFTIRYTLMPKDNNTLELLGNEF